MLIELLLLPIINYLIGFIILPYTILKLCGELACVISYGILILIITVLFKIYKIKFHFFINVGIMLLLIMLYCPRDLYGISDGGMLDFTPKCVDALFICILISIVQFVITKLLQLIFRK